MFHFKHLPVSAGLLAVAFAALPVGAAQAAETVYPLTINSCGHEITFKQAPARTSIGRTEHDRGSLSARCCRQGRGHGVVDRPGSEGL